MNRWAARGAILLFAIFVVCSVAFCVFEYHEEQRAIRAGEQYDSIMSDYIFLTVAAICALVGAVGAALVWTFTRPAKPFSET